VCYIVPIDKSVIPNAVPGNLNAVGLILLCDPIGPPLAGGLSGRISIMIKEDRCAVRSWFMYDWANSAFVTCITTVILQTYYLTLFVNAEDVAVPLFGAVWHTTGLALWAYTSAFSMFLVVLVAPVLGAIADMSRGKKKFLAFCVFVGAIATAALSLVTKGDYLLCSALYIVANSLWSAGNIFYDGFLPELTDDPGRMDAISAGGYGIGYLGGGLALILCIGLIFGNTLLGISKEAATRVSFLIVALWWAVFTIPLLRHVPEKGGTPSAVRGFGYARAGFGRLAKTLSKVRKLPNLGRMLIAFLLYNAGIGTIMTVAAAYGKAEIKLTDETLFGVFLMVQILGLPAAFAYIRFARKVGTRTSILIGLIVYLIVVVFAMQLSTALEFWILGALVALVQGGTQAMSRSLYGSMIPEDMSAEFFGFFSVFNKIGPFFGPLLFAVVEDAAGNSRLAILSLILFFILGFLGLLAVKVDKGREEAKEFKPA
jgi:UMF1 family MFS transporter